MSDSKPLKTLIDKLLRAYGYQDQLDEIKITEVYENVVGKMFSKHTQQLSYKDRVLTVKLDSAVLKQEMSYAKEAIRVKINQEMGRNLLDKIVII